MYLVREQSLARLAASLGALAAVTSATPTTTNSPSGGQPCADIVQLYAEFIAIGADGTFQVPGQVAFDCLESMPFRSDLAVSFIDEYSKYMEWQSTIEILKNPPGDYISPPVDLIGGLADIRQKAVLNEYSSQFDFDSELRSLVQAANDGHFSVQLCSQSIFAFKNEVPLVSASVDGLELPQIYTLADAELLAAGSQEVSPIVSINGEDAAIYLNKNFAAHQLSQDPDARYNGLFPSKAQDIYSTSVSTGAWSFDGGQWPGNASHILIFANETTATVPIVASWSSSGGDFNFTDSTAIFARFCLPDTSASSSAGSSGSSQPTIATPAESGPSGYPDPVLRNEYNLISGYYLDDSELQDVAVLQVPTFEFSGEFGDGVLPDNATAVVAQNVIDFIGTATTAGKTKIIIDLSGNGGGDIAAGFNFFRIFFPDIPVYSATRFRAHELVDLVGQAYTQVTKDDPEYGGPLVLNGAVSPDQNSDFASWADLYGPFDIMGGNSSSLYANFNFTETSTLSEPVSGYGPVPLDPSSRPFAVEDIIIMTDGYCASTCTTFTERMKKQGVRSIVFGGRPNFGPMQTLGGVKGGQSLQLSAINSMISSAYGLAVNASTTEAPLLTQEQLQRFTELAPADLDKFPLIINGGGVNFRNAYREGDDNTPLQFVYEAAECRLFYTVDNYLQPGTSWTAAALAVFGNGSCVQGSTNAAGSLSVSA